MRSEIKEIVLKPELIVQKSWGLAWHKEVDVKGMGNPLCLSGQGLASTGRPNESSVEGFSGSDFSKWLPAIRQEYRSQGGGAKKTISSLDKPGQVGLRSIHRGLEGLQDDFDTPSYVLRWDEVAQDKDVGQGGPFVYGWAELIARTDFGGCCK